MFTSGSWKMGLLIRLTSFFGAASMSASSEGMAAYTELLPLARSMAGESNRVCFLNIIIKEG